MKESHTNENTLKRRLKRQKLTKKKREKRRMEEKRTEIGTIRGAGCREKLTIQVST